MDIRYNNFITTDWDRIVYNAKVMNFAKDKKFLRKLIYSGRVCTNQTKIPKYSIGDVGSENNRNRFRHLYYKRLCDYIDAYQNKFGDDWDIHFQKSSDFYTNNGESLYTIYLFKIFDKVEVKKYSNNTSHTSHTVQDLVVFNTIGMRKDTGEFWIPRMQGARLTYSNREILTGYIHSHLKANSSLQRSPLILQDFCIGAESDASMLSGMLASEYSKEQFEIYLYTQDSTIECESGIGTPHIRFSGILAQNIRTLELSNEYEYARHISSILFSGELIDVNYYISDNLYHIKNNEVFHSFIKNLILTKLKDDDRWKEFLCKKGLNENYHSYDSLENVSMSNGAVTIFKDARDDNFPYIYYNGVRREAKVSKQQPKQEDRLKIEEFIVYPPLLNYIHEQLEHKLQQTAIAGSNIRRYYSSNNVSRYLR